VESASPRSTRDLARLVKRCLEEGRRVEIERLGTFRRTRDGGLAFAQNLRPTVFLAYVEEDYEKVDRLFHALTKAGFEPWMDRHKLLPGQNWPRALENAIETADFFVACLSRRSVMKRGTFQSEMRFAMDCARNAPLDSIYFIPLRLEQCEVPQQIRQQLQYVDFFPTFASGVRQLVGIIRKEWRRRPR